MVISGERNRLTQMSVLTSVFWSRTEIPENSSSQWEFQSYKESAYLEIEVMEFIDPIQARHVALVSSNTAPYMQIAEVKIYGRFSVFAV